jgi:hypothetical protein
LIFNSEVFDGNCSKKLFFVFFYDEYFFQPKFDSESSGHFLDKEERRSKGREEEQGQRGRGCLPC